LAGLDDTIQELNYEQARQELQRATIELNAVERRAEAGTTSEAELSRVRSAASGARSRVEQTRELLENRTLRSPISGYVATRAESLTEGNYLRRGVEVARIVDLARLEVEISVGEREVRFLEVGSPATVFIPSCEAERMDAAVEAIAAGSEPATGSFPVVVAWENECDDIRSGVSARVVIEPTNQRERLVIPASAVIGEEGEYVFLAENGRALRREVTVEERLGNRAAIAEGLAPGEVVIVSGLTVLADGDPVTVSIRDGE
jgi:membrane fusion protein (multidrug efflux system)